MSISTLSTQWQCSRVCSNNMLLCALQIILFIFYLLNILSHAIGFSLLVKLYRNGERTSQEVFLMTLSITAILRSISLILLYETPANTSLRTFIGKPGNIYVGIIVTVGIYFVYTLNLVYILINKFLQVYLHLRYPLYVTIGRTKCLISTTWCVAIGVCAVCMVYMVTRAQYQNIALIYIYLAIDLCLILFACYIYSYIFLKYKNTRRPPACPSRSQYRHRNIFVIFYQSRFTVSALLILSYIVFTTIPDIISCIYRFNNKTFKDEKWIVTVVCLISYTTSDIVDSWVYIFVHAPVRKLLRKHLRCLLRTRFERTQKDRSFSSTSAVVFANEIITQF